MGHTHLAPTVAKKVVLFSLLFFFFYHLAAQSIQVIDGETPPYTPEKLIEHIFQGRGIEIININYEGEAKAVGFFMDGNSAINLEKGVIMATGHAVDVAKANGYPLVDPDAGKVTSGGSVIDTDLDGLTEGGLRDIAKYEITFRPSGNKLQFRYVFASEEYPTFSCPSGDGKYYNDVFGFFISGPKPGGGSYNAENIAIVPGTANLPVAIKNVHNSNSINQCTPLNNQYYNDNTGSTSLSYNAYLDVFTAEVEVSACQIYTIKLSIGDGSSNGTDENFDSAVFLEGKSFEADTLQVAAISVSLDGTIVEGCSSAQLNFSVPQTLSSDLPLNYTIFGSATNGIDYQNIPSNLSIPAGSNSLSVPIIPIVDGAEEGTESIFIEVTSSTCQIDTFDFYIREPRIETPDLTPDTLICSGNSVNLDGTIGAISDPPLMFENTTSYPIPDRVNSQSPPSSVYSDIVVSGIVPSQLKEGLINSVCIDIDHTRDRELDIFLIAPGGQFIELSTDNGSIGDNYKISCFTPDAMDLITAGLPPFNGTFQPEGDWADLWKGNTSPVNGTWQLLVSDDQSSTSSSITHQINSWSISFNQPYQLSYSWTPTAGLSCTECPDPVASPTNTTKYYLTVSDTYGCQETDSITIEVITAIAAPTITCSDIKNNSITFSWDAVTGANSYEVNIDGTGWITPNNGSQSQLVTGLSLNQTVSFQVRGVGNCTALIGAAVCTTQSCGTLLASIAVENPISCNGKSDGAIKVSASEGTAPYTYTLGTETNTTGSFSNLSTGLHSLIITDANNCTLNRSIDLTEPDQLTLNASTQAEICSGAANGYATVEPAGGTKPYLYNWDANAGNQSTNTAVGLTDGDYTVTVTDANGCIAVETLTVEGGAVISLSVSKTDPTCENAINGKATVTASGGQTPYTYKWSDSNNQTTPMAENLGVGSYSVIVIDKNGCSASSQVNLEAPPALQIAASTFFTSCFNTTDGRANLTVSGGIAPYRYSWSDNGNSSDMRSDLRAGLHQITIEDSNGCGKTIEIEIFSPPTIMLDVSMNPASCFGKDDGSTTALATGGAGGFGYQWDDNNLQASATARDLVGGLYTVTAKDASGCAIEKAIEVTQPEALQITLAPEAVDCYGSASGRAMVSVVGGAGNYQYRWDDPDAQSSAQAVGLGPGNYTVTVTDANNCEATGTVTIDQPDELTSLVNIDQLSCPGLNENEASVTATGGTVLTNGAYTYNWSDPKAQKSARARDLAPGTYSVTVSDFNGCTVVNTIEIPTVEPIELMVDSIEVSCFGATDGRLSASASGGTGQLSFDWSNGASTNINNNLAAGGYCLTVTDENGCTASKCTKVGEPVPIVAEYDLGFVDCKTNSDGTIHLLPSGGTGSFSYSWTGPEGFTANTKDIEGLTNGLYHLTITDGAGCSFAENINLPKPVDIKVNFEVNPVICYGEATGTIAAMASGGSQNFHFNWSSGDTTAYVTDLFSGDYHLTVTDDIGCFVAQTVTIPQPEEVLLAQFDLQGLSCTNARDGAITISASGGTPDYMYSNDGINFSPYASFKGLGSGIYDIYVRDGQGCIFDSIGIEIENPQPIQVDLGPDITLELGRSIELAADIKNAIGNMNYEWGSQFLEGLSCADCPNPTLSTDISTTLDLRVTDENGCVGRDNITIRIKKEREIFVPTAFTPNDDQSNDRLVIHGKNGLRIVSFRVYDRWGELVYEQNGFEINTPDMGWDGNFRNQKLSSGLYIWQAEVEFLDGFKQLFKGETSLIR